MSQFTKFTVAGMILPAVPTTLATNAKADMATNVKATATMAKGDALREQAESDYCSTLATLHHLLPYAKDVDGYKQHPFVAAFFGRVPGNSDKGETMTESAASKWVSAAKAVVEANAPAHIVNGGRAALVRWNKSYKDATKDLAEAAKSSGVPTKVAKAVAEADMAKRVAVAEKEVVRLAKSKDAPSAEVIASEAIAKAVPESKAAKQATKDAKARASTRTAKAKQEAIAAAKVPAGRMDSIEAITEAIGRIREIDMADNAGSIRWEAIATSIVVTVGHGEATALATALAEAAANAAG